MDRYNLGMKVMHWLLAVVIFSLLTVGFYMSGMPNSDSKFEIYSIHKSFGVVAFVLILIRTVVRAFSKIPQMHSSISKVESKISELGVVIFYILMFLMPASGYVMSVSSGHPINLFNTGFIIPDFIGTNFEFASIASCVHEYTAFSLIGMIVIHILAALKHLIIDKVNIFIRMI
jgi:cytochrome b561